MKEKLSKIAQKLKLYKRQLIAGAAVLVVLTAAFWYGGGAPGLQGWSVQQPSVATGAQDTAAERQAARDAHDAAQQAQREEWASKMQTDDSEQTEQKKEQDAQVGSEQEAEAPAKPSEGQADAASDGIESRPGGSEGGMTVQEKLEAAAEIAGGSSPGVEQGSQSYSASQGMVIDASTGKDQYLTDPVPEGKPVPVEPQNVKVSDVAKTCTLSVRCDTILNHMDWLNVDKVELVPSDGVIFTEASVTFYEGESVFNLLQREMKKAKIHMEFENTPIYNSAYIEGINNLYEFDCGELSGWMYKVNDWFPNYGCSRYQLKEGDKVEWVYTCDLGVDVGGYYSTGGE